MKRIQQYHVEEKGHGCEYNLGHDDEPFNSHDQVIPHLLMHYAKDFTSWVYIT